MESGCNTTHQLLAPLHRLQYLLSSVVIPPRFVVLEITVHWLVPVCCVVRDTRTIEYRHLLASRRHMMTINDALYFITHCIY